MGFLDTLKKATGVGLSAAEQYQRAFEKGVFLGPQNYAEAVTLFLAAAKKAAEVGDTQIEPYARANAALYRFISAPKLDSRDRLTSCSSGSC